MRWGAGGGGRWPGGWCCDGPVKGRSAAAAVPDHALINHRLSHRGQSTPSPPLRLKDKRQEEDSDGEDEALPFTEEEKAQQRKQAEEHKDECRKVGPLLSSVRVRVHMYVACGALDSGDPITQTP
jgi:hypothetical protein